MVRVLPASIVSQGKTISYGESSLPSIRFRAESEALELRKWLLAGQSTLVVGWTVREAEGEARRGALLCGISSDVGGSA